jgi:hypothetical protein
MPNPGSDKYGAHYWCVRLKAGDVHLYADQVYTNDGDLVFISEKKGPNAKTLATFTVAKGEWVLFYAASVFDGRAVSVEHWPGEANSEYV